MQLHFSRFDWSTCVHWKLHSVELYIITESQSRAMFRLLLQEFVYDSCSLPVSSSETVGPIYNVSSYQLCVSKKNVMGNHKRNKSPLHITVLLDLYKPKGNRHKTHRIKWAEHVCKNYKEQMMKRDRTPRQMSREAIFLGLHKKRCYIC